MEHRGMGRRHHARTASSTKGRLRIRLDRGSRSAPLLGQVKQHLEAQPGVCDVDTNARTGSVTIRFDHTKQNKGELFRLLSDLDVVMDEALNASDAGEAAVGRSASGKGLATAVDDLSAWIRQTAGVRVDLRKWVPLGLAGAGVWSIARQGPMIESVPGWVFLWLALDVFVKLHPERMQSASPPTNER